MKKIFKFLLVIALIVLINPLTAKANVQDGLFRADENITVSDEIEGSSFIAGNKVAINNKINGILFGAGYTVNVTGESDYAFVAGNMVNINGASFKDGFLAGQIVEVNDSKIERDLYLAGQNIKVTGSIGRNLYVAGTDVVIDGSIIGDVYVDASSITINSNSNINGLLHYNDDADITISKDAIIASKDTYKNREVSNKTNNVSIGSKIISKLIDTVFGLINILVVGLLMVLLIPGLFKKLREINSNRLLPSFAWGLLILICTPLAALLAMITYVGISLGVIMMVLYGVLLYVSTILCAYTITSMILKDKVKNPYLVLLIGLSCLYIIKLIPFLGGLISFAIICLGLGLITNLIKRK